MLRKRDFILSGYYATAAAEVTKSLEIIDPFLISYGETSSSKISDERFAFIYGLKYILLFLIDLSRSANSSLSKGCLIEE